MKNVLIVGDCLVELKELPDNSVDSIVTDPPYGLSFMGKKWDYDVPSVDVWKEALRVLKPGGHLLSFGGTRTYHRLVVAIEDAGFEIRDQIQWIYGSGFPKSLDVSKAIDKAAGAEREVVGHQEYSAPDIRGNSYDQSHVADRERLGVAITAPATDLAKKWRGWGTALKPANEPICVARKPLEGTVAQNVEKWGTGALNIDASRISYAESEQIDFTKVQDGNIYGGNGIYGEAEQKQTTPLFKPNGRWPANVIFDEVTGCAAWSRFFYCAKASKSERNAGLEGMPEIRGGSEQFDSRWKEGTGEDRMPKNRNHHPTVKPIKLMEYLIRLVTPPGGTVLDPFAGSGTTLVAAKGLGYDFVGIELSEEYAEIIINRIKAVKEPNEK